MNTLKSLAELRAERDVLDKLIAEKVKNERSAKVQEVRAMVAEYGLTAADVFSAGKGSKSGGKVAAKYRNPTTGETWTGRGKAPVWIKDAADRTIYEIKDVA